MKREDLHSKLPQTKFDVIAAMQLINLEEEEIKLIFPEILFWIADPNWPVAEYIVPVLLKHPNILLPYLMKHLSEYETDEEFKASIIMLILPRLSIEMQNQVFPYVKRICENPSETERSRSCDIAQDYLDDVMKRDVKPF